MEYQVDGSKVQSTRHHQADTRKGGGCEALVELDEVSKADVTTARILQVEGDAIGGSAREKCDFALASAR